MLWGQGVWWSWWDGQSVVLHIFRKGLYNNLSSICRSICRNPQNFGQLSQRLSLVWCILKLILPKSQFTGGFASVQLTIKKKSKCHLVLALGQATIRKVLALPRNLLAPHLSKTLFASANFSQFKKTFFCKCTIERLTWWSFSDRHFQNNLAQNWNILYWICAWKVFCNGISIRVIEDLKKFCEIGILYCVI